MRTLSAFGIAVGIILGISWGLHLMKTQDKDLNIKAPVAQIARYSK